MPRNLSLGGMFLRTSRIQPVGTVVSFEIALADGFVLIEGVGEVAWVRRQDEGSDQPEGIAVRFRALDEQGRELILKMLEEQVKSGGEPFDVDEVPSGVVSTAQKPNPAEEPSLADEPSLVAEPSPAEEPSPVKEPIPVMEPIPAMEPSPAMAAIPQLEATRTSDGRRDRASGGLGRLQKRAIATSEAILRASR